MKIKSILSSSVLAGAVLFSATACTPSDGNENQIEASPTVSATAAPKTSSTATTAVTPTETSTATAGTPEVVVADPADVVTSYYNFVSAPDTLAKVKQAAAIVEADGDIAQLVTDFPEGLQYFDTSSNKNISNAISQLLANATQASKTSLSDAVVPAEAVTISGNNAIVKSDMITITLDMTGEALPVNGEPFFAAETINLVKLTESGWVMVAEPARQAIP